MQTPTCPTEIQTPVWWGLVLVVLLGCARPPAAEAPDAAPPSDAAFAMDAGCIHPNLPNVRACCGAPGERPGGNCIPWATLDRCSKEGETHDVKALRHCCPGLQVITMSAPLPEPAADGGTCSSGYHPIYTTYICARCPDGTCGPGENRCNCPEDCQ
jgi:hypothetical protein